MIEVVIAIGVFAGSILAIMAMLGAISRTTTDVLDAGISARLADAIRAELQALPISDGPDNLSSIIPVNPHTADPLKLYATRDGSRVVLEIHAGNSPTATPPGMPEAERYFLIEVRRLGDSLTYDAADVGGFMALGVKVYWPYQVRTGPNTSVAAEDHRRSMAIFNVAVRRTQ